MKGARGLLISITGGKDLTLFEVDEAATRIREEVDNDANIIVGATFDESLDGVIRVSVVATGIDAVARAALPTPAAGRAGGRLAALPPACAPTTSAHAEERAVQQQKQVAAAPAPVRASADQIDRAALAAIAEAVSPPAAPVAQAPEPLQSAAYGDVSVRPIPPKPSLFPDHEEPMSLNEAPPPAAFIPQQAERMPARAPRMPQFDELPVPAQNQIPPRPRRPPRSIRRRPASRCCSVWPMSASAAATRTASRRSRPAAKDRPWRRCRRCRSASRSGQIPHSMAAIRYRSMRAVRPPRRRASCPRR